LPSSRRWRRTLRERGAEDVATQPLEAGALARLEAHTGVQAVPAEVCAPGRKRQLLPTEHLYAPGALARPLAEGRLPDERGLLDHGLGVVEALDVLGVRHHAAEGEAVVGAESVGSR
jgi:hypothetical protein